MRMREGCTYTENEVQDVKVGEEGGDMINVVAEASGE